MTRSVEMWIGKTDDTPIPPRVKLRVFERGHSHCHNCGIRILAGKPWQCDHIIALANSGSNAESNLQCLCYLCHQQKTASDVAQKSKTYMRKAKHFGLKKSKQPISGWQKFDGTPVRNPKLRRRA